MFFLLADRSHLDQKLHEVIKEVNADREHNADQSITNFFASTDFPHTAFS